jgi:hypothetical protein
MLNSPARDAVDVVCTYAVDGALRMPTAMPNVGKKGETGIARIHGLGYSFACRFSLAGLSFPTGLESDDFISSYAKVDLLPG